MTEAYYDLTRLIERLHRRFLDVLRAELDRLDVVDINAVQCLLLSNIGKEEVNVRNLMDRGYYLGSNASYNIKKLVEAGYLEQQRSPHDRRSTLLKVSQKGLELCSKIAISETQRATALMASDGGRSMEEACRTLRGLERAWDEQAIHRA